MMWQGSRLQPRYVRARFQPRRICPEKLAALAAEGINLLMLRQEAFGARTALYAMDKRDFVRLAVFS
jgi:hypothetical protein